MANAINWFEIPVTDMPRAVAFYSAILGAEISADPAAPGYQMAVLPYQDGVGGALLSGEGYVPSPNGALLYLNGGDDLNNVLGKVDAAGGQVLTPKTGIGENGFMGFFLDSEGNKIGLHSMG